MIKLILTCLYDNITDLISNYSESAELHGATAIAVWMQRRSWVMLKATGGYWDGTVELRNDLFAEMFMN